MGKKLAVYFLIAALISVNCSSLFIFAGFELNRNYIAAKLCENRDKPWLHCNGKCYFMKKIKQAEEKDKTGERQVQKNLFQEALFISNPEIKFYSKLVQVMPVPNHPFTLPTAHLPVFQPPQLS